MLWRKVVMFPAGLFWLVMFGVLLLSWVSMPLMAAWAGCCGSWGWTLGLMIAWPMLGLAAGRAWRILVCNAVIDSLASQ